MTLQAPSCPVPPIAVAMVFAISKRETVFVFLPIPIPLAQREIVTKTAVTEAHVIKDSVNAINNILELFVNIKSCLVLTIVPIMVFAIS